MDWIYDGLLIAYTFMWFMFGRCSGIHSARKRLHTPFVDHGDPAYPFSMREEACEHLTHCARYPYGGIRCNHKACCAWCSGTDYDDEPTP